MTRPDTAGALVRWGAAQLATSPTPLLDARILFLDAAGWAHEDLIAGETASLPSEVIDRYAASLARRADDEPVAYITGRQEFFGRMFVVNRDVLIPRPETEMIVEAATKYAPSYVLDLGTGSGCLLGTILAECPHAEGVAWDICPAALAMAKTNLERLGVRARARVVEQSFADAPVEDQPFDLVVTNPPYIETGAQLPASVRGFEPSMALFAGVDGLDAYRQLAPTLAAVLAPQGAGLLEIGTGQGADVTAILQEAMPSRRVSVHRDLAGHERMVEVHPIDPAGMLASHE